MRASTCVLRIVTTKIHVIVTITTGSVVSSVSAGVARLPCLGGKLPPAERSAGFPAGRKLFRDGAKTSLTRSASPWIKMDLPEDNAGSHQGKDAAAAVATGGVNEKAPPA